MPLSKENRLTKKKDIDGLFKKKKTVRGDFLFIRYSSEKSPASKVVFIVPNKVYSKAVDRNRVKRVLSEIVKLRLYDLHGVDSAAVVVYKKADEEALKDDLIKVINRLKEHEKYAH